MWVPVETSRYRCIRAAQQCNSTPAPGLRFRALASKEFWQSGIFHPLPDRLFLPDGSLQPLGVDLFHPLNGFSQPCSAGYLVGLQEATPQGRWSFRCGDASATTRLVVRGSRCSLRTPPRHRNSGRLPGQVRQLPYFSPPFAEITTIYLIIINLYAVFKMERLFYL